MRLDYVLPREPSALLLPLIGGIVGGIERRLFVQDEGRLWGQVELPDPGDASDHPDGGVDLVFRVAGGFVDEGRSEGRVPSELECTDTHRECCERGGQSTKGS